MRRIMSHMGHETVTSASVLMPDASRRTRRRAWRALWVQVHLYLGLFVGALLVVFGVTGSVLVFFQEIDEWLNPTLLTVEVPAPGPDEYRPVGEILAAAERAAAPEAASPRCMARRLVNVSWPCMLSSPRQPGSESLSIPIRPA